MSSLKARYVDSPAAVKVLQWIGVVCLFTFLATLIIALLQYLSGWNTSDIGNLKTIQAFQTLCVFLLPPLCVAYLWSEQPIRWLHLNRVVIPATIWLLVPLSMVIAAPGVNLLAHLNRQLDLPAFLQSVEDIMKEMELRSELLTEQFLQVSTFGALLINILIMAFLPALGEELTFRGLLLQSLSARKHLAIWIVAIIFSAVHFQFYGFIPRMLFGAYFGYLLLWTDSLWIPVLAHFTNNALAVIAAFIAYRYQLDTAVTDNLGTGDTLWLGILSLCLTAALIVCIYQLSARQHQN